MILMVSTVQVRQRFEKLKQKKEEGDPIDYVADGEACLGQRPSIPDCQIA